MAIRLEIICLPSRNTAHQNFVILFLKFLWRKVYEREEHEKAYLQPYSVTEDDGIQKSKTPVRLEKTTEESSKKIKSYLQSDFQKTIQK